MPLKLLKGIRDFKNNQFQEKKELISVLSKGQSPESIFISCSDSRIDPKYFTNANLGEIFTLRNAGNIISPAGTAPSADATTLEYGIKALNIPHIVVCGHSGCGAMQGVMDPKLEEKLPHTHAWLCQCKPLLKNITAEQPELRLKQLIQANILEQIERLKSYDFINERVANHTLTLHAWYYEFETSEIYVYNFDKNEFISFEQTIEEITRPQLELIVHEEILSYINNLIELQLGHNELLKLCDRLERENISSIWPHIKTNIAKNAQQRLGDLFAANNVPENTQLNALLAERQFMPISNLSSVREKLLCPTVAKTESHSSTCPQAFYQSNKRKPEAQEFTSNKEYKTNH